MVARCEARRATRLVSDILLELCTLKAFYERGCQEKHLTASRLPEVKTARGSQP
jgi:hypothetical protein